MIDDMLGQFGVINLTLMAVAVALLVVVIIFMAYFRTLLSIANFAYPNAKFRARGVHFTREENTSHLIDGSNLSEIFSELESTGVRVQKEVRDDPDAFEDALERNFIADMIDLRHSVPDQLCPFVDAWLLRYDFKMIKRVMKGVWSGTPKEEISLKVYPVNTVDEKLLEDIMGSRDIHEVLNILKDTSFGDIFAGINPDEDFFVIDRKMDSYAFGRLKTAVLRAETEDLSAAKLFVGKYTDVFNIKTILRGLKFGLTSKELQQALLPAGRELPMWKLERMCESGTMEEALVELDGTSYSDLRKVGGDELYDLEKNLDTMLLDMSSNLMTQYILTVGPTMRFLMGKEFEVRNLKVMVRGIYEGIGSKMIKEMMILEGNR